MTKYTRIIFDLDGTLVDSLPEIHAAAAETLREMGYEPLSVETIRGFIGHGVEALVGDIMHAVGATADKARWIDRFGVYYHSLNGKLTTPYAGVPELLAKLQQSATIGVCTNKPLDLAKDVLNALSLGPFHTIIGGDSLPQRKPDPAPLLEAARQMGEGALLYVGDSEVDAATADAAGVDFALFTGGYRKAAVEELPHKLVFDDYAELDRLLHG
ncbi:phosphoglycolate phosphatase [Falsirhodobacter sp. alg1]|uniref:phosphoglycolate phosphatase n=1 Tax=Falsirhodobacter sp. alg1 TaxID=1472418 RepID=UPI000788DDC3|nr:phosphoglycolate phosphatase [Falsirhodobacter sp. alg1]